MALAVKEIPRPALLSGAPLQNIQEPVRVVLAGGRDEISDYLELPCAVVSERMRSALDRAGVDNIQYVRATLEQRVSERTISGYWIANVFGALACVDRDASVIERESDSYPGDLRSFEIDLRATYGLGLFRVAEDRRLIAVHERVRAVLERTSLRGVLFQAPSKYDGRPVSATR